MLIHVVAVTKTWLPKSHALASALRLANLQLGKQIQVNEVFGTVRNFQNSLQHSGSSSVATALPVRYSWLTTISLLRRAAGPKDKWPRPPGQTPLADDSSYTMLLSASLRAMQTSQRSANSTLYNLSRKTKWSCRYSILRVLCCHRLAAVRDRLAPGLLTRHGGLRAFLGLSFSFYAQRGLWHPEQQIRGMLDLNRMHSSSVRSLWLLEFSVGQPRRRGGRGDCSRSSRCDNEDLAPFHEQKTVRWTALRVTHCSNCDINEDQRHGSLSHPPFETCMFRRG